MVVFTVMYPNEPGKHFDMAYYCSTHIAMVKEKLGDVLKGVSVERGVSGGAPGSTAGYTTVCHLRFESMEDIGKYVAPHSPAFDADVPNFTDITPQFQISEEVM